MVLGMANGTSSGQKIVWWLLGACFSVLVAVVGMTLATFADEHVSLREDVSAVAEKASSAKQDAEYNGEAIAGMASKIDNVASKLEELNVTIAQFLAVEEERRRREARSQ